MGVKGSGRRRTVAQMEKDARSLELFCQGQTYRQIGTTQGVSSTAAYHAVKRALADRQKDKLEQVDHFTAAIERIQAGLRRCQEIIDGRFVSVTASGKVAVDPDTGEPLLDAGPKQRAVTEMRHLNEQLIVLMDLKPPAKSRVEVVTEDVVDREIAKLAEELALAQKQQQTEKDSAAQ
jgi:hypothetical protein